MMILAQTTTTGILDQLLAALGLNGTAGLGTTGLIGIVVLGLVGWWVWRWWRD